MKSIDVKRMGMAVGLTGTLLYLGCVIVMFTLGRESAIKFFNSLLHGLDTSKIFRTEIPLWELAVGVVQTFILGWLLGACVAWFYNATIKSK